MGIRDKTFRKNDSHLLRDIFLALARYVRGQLLIVLIMTGLYSAGFFFAGVPLWLLAGVLCGPFHLIPAIGTLFAAAIPVLFHLVSGGDLWDVVRALLVVGAVQLLETFYLTPRILGRELKLHPIVIVLAVLAGALLFGPVGALLSAPVVAVGLLVWRAWRKKRGLNLEPDLQDRDRESVPLKGD
jgi:predicted PurR-regulated permease PerM